MEMWMGYVDAPIFRLSGFTFGLSAGTENQSGTGQGNACILSGTWNYTAGLCRSERRRYGCTDLHTDVSRRGRRARF